MNTSKFFRGMGRMACLLTVMVLLGSCGDNPKKRLAHYKAIVQELSSATYQGRGYAMDGVLKAGDYIADEFRKSGVRDVQRQTFAIDINTFPGKMEAAVDGRALTAGRDFVLREFSPGVKGEFGLVFVDTLDCSAERLKTLADSAADKAQGDIFVVCDFWKARTPDIHAALQAVDTLFAGTIFTWDEPLKFYKAYGETVKPKPIVWTTREAIEGASNVSFDIENRFLSGYESDNIIAHVPGRQSDSCFVFTAHYDHLGNLGADVFYPGADDNASGTAAIITLAEYYAHHRPQYDMWFVAFSGEDANLRGSTYFAEHPLVPLEQIRYLINLDMIGDNNPVQYCEVSDAGMPLYPLWEELNEQLGCFESLDRGKLAANSDHYPFAERGVPTVFFENEKGDVFPYYHTVDDDWDHAVFTSYEPIFKLVTAFVDKVSK